MSEMFEVEKWHPFCTLCCSLQQRMIFSFVEQEITAGTESPSKFKEIVMTLSKRHLAF